MQQKANMRELSKEDILRYSDECYVNGLDNISVSSLNDVELCNNPRRLIYDYRIPYLVDLNLSKEIKTRRMCTNYDNEFLVSNIIENKSITAVDLRLFEYMDKNVLNDDEIKRAKNCKKLIEYFNSLKDIANAMIESDIQAPLREMSKESITLDTKSVIELPNLIIK